MKKMPMMPERTGALASYGKKGAKKGAPKKDGAKASAKASAKERFVKSRS